MSLAVIHFYSFLCCFFFSSIFLFIFVGVILNLFYDYSLGAYTVLRYTRICWWCECARETTFITYKTHSIRAAEQFHSNPLIIQFSIFSTYAACKIATVNRNRTVDVCWVSSQLCASHYEIEGVTRATPTRHPDIEKCHWAVLPFVNRNDLGAVWSLCVQFRKPTKTINMAIMLTWNR